MGTNPRGLGAETITTHPAPPLYAIKSLRERPTIFMALPYKAIHRKYSYYYGTRIDHPASPG